MKILYECFSCSPYYGSDEEIGWMWPYLMSEYHEVWALVRKDRRNDIEKYCSEHKTKDIHFIYCDIPDRFNFYYKNMSKNKNGAIDFLAYQFLWQIVAYFIARQLHQQIHFDLVHHVSTNDFRLLGWLYKLKVPYIIGPIGGAQMVPDGLKYYIRNHEKNEKLRSLLNNLMIHIPGYKKALQKATIVFFSNYETRNHLQSYIKNPGKCRILTEVGFKDELLIKENDVNIQKRIEKKDETVFMWAGRIEYRKGLEFLIDILKKIPLNKKWKVILCGDGNDREFVEALCCQTLFADRVFFTGRISYEKMQNMYEQASVFVFPSLRETTGTVIIEAMGHKVPVICLEQGGAAMIVTKNNGYPIKGNTRKEYVNNFASAMVECIEMPEVVNLKGNEAYKCVLEHYTWRNKIKNMECEYMKLLSGDVLQE